MPSTTRLSCFAFVAGFLLTWASRSFGTSCGGAGESFVLRPFLYYTVDGVMMTIPPPHRFSIDEGEDGFVIQSFDPDHEQSRSIVLRRAP